MVKALLLAGGLGTRLRPLTETVPKCLVPIAGASLLDRWVDALVQAGVQEAMINTHHLVLPVRKAIRRINTTTRLHLTETFEPELLGSAGTIAANREFCVAASALLVIYTDNLSDIELTDLLHFHCSHTDSITMLLFHAAVPQACGIVELDDEHTIVNFQEKPAAPKSNLANAGIYVMSPEACQEIAGQQTFDLARDALPRFVGRMRGYVHEGYHRDIGTLDAWALACRESSRLAGSVTTSVDQGAK